MDPKSDLNLLYKRLCDSVKAENDEETHRIASQILLETPQDTEVLVFQVVALIKLGKFKESLEILQPLKSLADPFLLYCLCYCLYKKGDFLNCLDRISHADKASFHGFPLLEAQIYYKQEKYEDAFKIYHSLLEKSSVVEENFEDLAVNMLSAGFYAGRATQEKGVKVAEGVMAKKKEVIREILFNVGLIYASLGQFQGCLALVKRFRTVIEEENDPQAMNDSLLASLERDHIESLLYVFRAEDYDEKVKYYSQFEEKEGLDPYVRTVLLNNLAVFRSQGTHFQYQDCLKTLEAAKNSAKGQELVIKINKILVSLGKNRLVEAQKIISELETSPGKEELKRNPRFIAAKFYLLYKGRNFKGIEALFKETLAFDKTLKPTLLLIKAEISRLLHKNQETLGILSELVKENNNFLTNEPFSILLLSLLSQLPKENLTSARDMLVELKKAGLQPEIQILLGDLYEKNEEFAAAAGIYESVLSKAPEASPLGKSLVYRLLRCYSAIDSNKAEGIIKKIELPTELITEEKEIKRLLDKEAGFLSQKTSKVPGSPRSPKSEELINKPIKKHKKKKKRLPKNFDPNKPGSGPDPERWLPLYMRSKYKGKKGRKGRGAQGEVSGKETVGTFKGAASTAHQEVVTSKKATKSKKKRK